MSGGEANRDDMELVYNSAQTEDVGVGAVSLEIVSPATPVKPTQKPPMPEILQFDLASDIKPCGNDEARAALLKYIAGSWCWGSGPAAKFEYVGSITPFSSFYVKQETFVEHRCVAPAFVPYYANLPATFTTKGAGVPPHAWDIELPIQNFFVDSVTLHEIAYTSYICTCFRCNGSKQGNVNTICIRNVLL